MTPPTLYMTIGIPGSGKTHWTSIAGLTNIPVFSSDEIREELHLDPTKKEDNNKVFDELHKRILEVLSRGESAIYDATNMNRKKRMKFLEKTAQLPIMRVAVLFTTPVDICIERDLKREKPVGREVINKMVAAFQAPWLYEGWNKIICIPNDDPITYPIEDMDQKNPHHKLTLNQHMDAAEEYAYEHGFGKLVQDAALYHDLGKRYTQSLDDNGIAHYYSHHNVGAYYYLSGFSNITLDDLYIANLINWHMAPYMEWKQSAKTMEHNHEMMGDQMFGDIWRLHECDEAAH